MIMLKVWGCESEFTLDESTHAGVFDDMRFCNADFKGAQCWVSLFELARYKF